MIKDRPLTTRELIPDACLRALAGPNPERQSGFLSDEDTAIVVMILPDFCRELMARRFLCKTCESTYKISNQCLRDLSIHDPERSRGELKRKHHIILCARLSSMCRELLALRSIPGALAA